MPKTADQYASALYELSKDTTKEKQSDLVKLLIKTLKENKSLFLLPQIVKKLQAIIDKERERNLIRVSTPDKLTDEEKENIKLQFGEGEYIFEENDESIAGLIIQKNEKLFYSTLSKATIQLENKLIV